MALADLDGDHRADVCALTSSGMTCATSAGTSFGAFSTRTYPLDFLSAGGWSLTVIP